MSITDFIECINKVFEQRYKDKGFFVATIQEEKLSFPIFKKFTIKVIHVPTNEIVFTFTFQDKVPTDERDKFMNNCLKKIIVSIVEQIDKIWEYGNRS